MLNLKRIRIEGFRSYTRPTVVKLGRGPGLCLLAGENGAGKSSIWEALVWVLFGKTTRGAKGKTVADWSGDSQCSVELEFEVDSRDYTVRRTYDPITLTLQSSDDPEPRAVLQEDVDALLRHDFVTFTNSVVFGQFADYFFDMPQTQQMSILSDTLGLMYWERASDAAKQKAKALDAMLTELRMQEQRVTGMITATQASLEGTVTAEGAFETSRDERIAAVMEEEAAAAVTLKTAQSKLLAFNQVLLQKVQEVAAAKRQLVKITSEEEKRRVLGDDFNEEYQDTHIRLAHAKEHLVAIKTLGARCEVCLTDIDAGAKKTLLQQAQAKVNELTGRHRSLTQLVERHREELKAFQLEHRAVEDLIRELELTVRDLKKHSIPDATAQVKAADAAIDKLADTRRRLGTEKNPHTRVRAQLEKQITQQNADLTRITEQIGDSGAAKEAIEFWGKAFKDVRLWLVDQALIELELYVNNAISDLGLSDWTVKFDIERESSDKKSMIRGFAIMISFQGGDPVPWESWSGGETQRLRVAGALGLATLITQHRGIEANVEVFDEPTAYLADSGVDQLVDLLAQRAANENKTLWMIDHRVRDSQRFNEVVLVKKTDRGSHIVVS